jgi:hypothetical protein
MPRLKSADAIDVLSELFVEALARRIGILCFTSADNTADTHNRDGNRGGIHNMGGTGGRCGEAPNRVGMADSHNDNGGPGIALVRRAFDWPVAHIRERAFLASPGRPRAPQEKFQGSQKRQTTHISDS